MRKIPTFMYLLEIDEAKIRKVKNRHDDEVYE